MTPKSKILVVEDEQIVAMDLRSRLETLGYAVAGTAVNAAEAVRLAAECAPDLVLMDIMLEGKTDGIQAATEIRNKFQIPVIYLTSFSDAETIERAKSAEPFGYLRKPLEQRELQAAIETALYKHGIERKLLESEARYKRLVESATDYIYTVKVEKGRAASTCHGPACVAVTGYTSAEYEADPDLWFKMVHIDDRKLVLEQAEWLLAGKTSQPLEHRIMHKSGRICWIRNTPVPHLDQSGKLVAYDGLVSDITDRKLAEEQIKEHARKLEIINRIIAAVNKAGDIAALVEQTLNSLLELIRFKAGCIYLVNDKTQMAEIACWKNIPADFLEQFGRVSLADGQFRTIFSGDKSVFYQNFSRVDPERARQWNMLSVAKIPLVSKERVVGRIMLADSEKHVFTVEEQEIILSIGRQLGTAIAKIQSEIALRESEDKYRTISEQSLVGIHIIKDDRVIFINDGWIRIFGYDRQDVAAWQSEGILNVVHPDDRDFVRDQLRRKQSGSDQGVMPVYDCRFLSKSGELKWVLLHSRSVPFADGSAIIGVLIDITDRKLAEQALATANLQLKSREEQLRSINQQLFAANEQLMTSERNLMKANREKEVLLKEIHHRVKNNLQVVASLLKLQLGHIKDEAMVNILRECQNRIKAIAIVHEKLYQSNNLAEIDIGDYIRSLIKHLFRMYLANPDSIRMKIAVEHVSLGIDQAIPCSLIINELVSNSLKYAFPQNREGEIGIVLKSNGHSGYVLTVSDDGIGFPGEIDFRNSPSLGLQLVMTFAEQLGGTVSLDNSQGTTFTIEFAGDKR